MAEQLSDEVLASLTLEDKICPLPNTSLVKNGGRNRPNYVWNEMHNQPPPIVQEWQADEIRLRSRLEEQQLARFNSRGEEDKVILSIIW